jgi:hypothetical protein
MRTMTDILAYIPLVTLLAYIPLVCYLDWKYRVISHDWWMYLIALNVISTAGLFLPGVYEVWMFVPSLVIIVCYFAAMKLHYIEGADFMYISLISLFFIYNPLSGHWFMALPFSIFLLAMMIVTFGLVIEYNWLSGKGLVLDYPRGIPMMFPISAALILTVVLA